MNVRKVSIHATTFVTTLWDHSPAAARRVMCSPHRLLVKVKKQHKCLMECQLLFGSHDAFGELSVWTAVANPL